MEYEAIQGKTYSLFGFSSDTSDYYSNVNEICDRLSVNDNGLESELIEIRKASKSKYSYLKWKYGISNVLNFDEIEEKLSAYIGDVNSQRKGLGVKRIWEKTLGLNNFQYLLYMIEIELTNRINIDKFKSCEYKIGLLPHCVHDLKKDCMAASDGLEHVCRKCSKECYIRQTSDLLNSVDIHPYIWRDLKLKKIFKRLFENYKSVGVLGMACVPELVNGLRKCDKYGIPAIGVPLNANRCVRWMGEFHDNSVDLRELERLIGIK
jgi:hypothetical protein